VRVRGQIAALRSDAAASDRWFAQAVRLAPSYPLAELEWAEALLARGDVDGAIAKLTIAHEKGPRFADPLELWGEALLKKGDAAGAVTRFEEADAYAPHWAHNHLRWGQTLAVIGKDAKASAQFAAARNLEMSAADAQVIASLH
jgi:tetratricopeptide (TPR) repeat protein